MRNATILLGLTVALGFFSVDATSAEQAKVNESIKKGGEYLKKRHEALTIEKDFGRNWRFGVIALNGMAMIEAGIPRTDPVLKKMAEAIRAEALSQFRTYNFAVDILFLDRYGEPSDVPLIQLLGIRLYSGMLADGTWTYDCGTAWTNAEVTQIQTALKAPQGLSDPKKEGTGKDGISAKVHPEVRRYLLSVRQKLSQDGRSSGAGDNSNTQFGLIGLWVASRHHISFEDALSLIDAHFLLTQNRRDGGWGYDEAQSESKCAMSCAGLLGLAVGVAGSAGAGKEKNAGPDDPFLNPKNPPLRENSAKTEQHLKSISGGFSFLSREIKTLDEKKPSYYTLWSIERVAMIYQLEKIGDMKWHERGCETILAAQNADGSWSGEQIPLVDTAFCILFLTRSNYAADLTEKLKGKVKDPATAELRGTRGVKPTFETTPPPDPEPVETKKIQQNDEADRVAKELTTAGKDWQIKVKAIGDSKGSEFTFGLARAIPILQGERRDQAREALAERLTRMTAKTLQTMLKDSDAEIRRAACLACGMKDDKTHISDLIDKIDDSSLPVVIAARAGLKSLTGKDFGPASDANAIDKAKAKADWKTWLDSQSKK